MELARSKAGQGMKYGIWAGGWLAPLHSTTLTRERSFTRGGMIHSAMCSSTPLCMVYCTIAINMKVFINMQLYTSSIVSDIKLPLSKASKTSFMCLPRILFTISKKRDLPRDFKMKRFLHFTDRVQYRSHATLSEFGRSAIGLLRRQRFRCCC